MYLIREIESDNRKLEMCFDCSNFQYQLDRTKGPEDHVFQTIFLNKKHEQTWSREKIRKDKISTCRFQSLSSRADRLQFARTGGTSSATHGHTMPLSCPSSGLSTAIPSTRHTPAPGPS